MFVKVTKDFKQFKTAFSLWTQGFLTRRIFAQKSKSEFIKKEMKANVCENSTCHQVNKTKTRIVKLLLLSFIQDSGDGRFMV